MGFGDIIGGVSSLFGGGEKKKETKNKTPPLAKEDIDAALEKNLNSITAMFNTYSMQTAQREQIREEENNTQQILLFAGIGGMVLILGFVILKR